MATPSSPRTPHPSNSPRVINVLVQNEVVVPAEQTPLVLEFHDHITFHCDEGTVEIRLDPGTDAFDREQFSSGGPPLRAVRQGRFVLRCTVTIPGRGTFGWGTNNPKSGTDVIIKTPDGQMP